MNALDSATRRFRLRDSRLAQSLPRNEILNAAYDRNRVASSSGPLGGAPPYLSITPLRLEMIGSGSGFCARIPANRGSALARKGAVIARHERWSCFALDILRLESRLIRCPDSVFLRVDLHRAFVPDPAVRCMNAASHPIVPHRF